MDMKRLAGLFKPRQDNFISLLIKQAELSDKGLQALLAYMNDGNEASAEVVRQTEKDADEVRRILIDELNRTFSTPMDREDIFALSRAIDDIIDYAYSTVDEMQILHVTANTYMQRMVSLLRDAANEVHMAMLRIKGHPGVATEHAQRAKALENRVESVYREAIAALFEGPAEPARIVEMLKLREIYRHLSNAADRGDEAANIISDVVVKMT
jgi:predicted phosphate transport protein (TIGR00153 family)